MTSHVKSDYYARIRANVNAIVTNMYRLLSTHRYVAHHKPVAKVLLLLTLKTDKFLSDGNGDRLKWLMMVVMVKLNRFGIVHCKPPNFNFLLFNNIDFGNMAKSFAIRNRCDGVWFDENDERRKQNDYRRQARGNTERFGVLVLQLQFHVVQRSDTVAIEGKCGNYRIYFPVPQNNHYRL